jgi:3-isopropylmalate/(R)-2-methylmalate dehydratase small subunit
MTAVTTPRAEGHAWVLGDNVDTDVIIPARYLLTSDPGELGKHCMEDLDPSFASTVRTGDVLVAGQNFGCGSSREHAPLAIKGAGVAAVIAASFARIFYRNAINIGLAILECPEAIASMHTGDELRVDLATGRIENVSTGETFQAKSYPESILRIIAAGGLIAATREKLRAAGKLPNTPAAPATTPAPVPLAMASSMAAPQAPRDTGREPSTEVVTHARLPEHAAPSRPRQAHSASSSSED